MPTGHTTAQQKKVVNPKPSSKRAREQRSDDGPVILPGMEHFVDLVRKVKRPALVVRLLERASGGTLPELLALADAAKGKLPVESRQAVSLSGASSEAAAGALMQLGQLATGVFRRSRRSLRSERLHATGRCTRCLLASRNGLHRRGIDG